jgi:hypothetical protein
LNFLFFAQFSNFFLCSRHPSVRFRGQYERQRTAVHLSLPRADRWSVFCRHRRQLQRGHTHSQSFGWCPFPKFAEICGNFKSNQKESLFLKATDADKGDFGIVRYTLIPSVPAQRFEINDESGLVSSRVTFIDSSPENEPFEFTVQARDSPGQVNFKAAAATVIVSQGAKREFFYKN